MGRDERAITLGHPSYVWREGQERRLAMIALYAPLAGARVLDVGCGLGLFLEHMRAMGAVTHGTDVDLDKLGPARATADVVQAPAEALPYCDEAFDVLLSHEVLEHVADDAAAVREAWRVLRPGGRLVVFVPNRLYPFETHGVYWRGRYHFGNVPLVGYLPNRWRRRLCPHVRAYTRQGLLRLLDELPGRVVAQHTIYAGYDSLIARRPILGRFLRRLTHALEGTPLAALGLSHLLVFEKAAAESDGNPPCGAHR